MKISTNNQLIILKPKRSKNFQVHENLCVDNYFEASSETFLGKFKTLEEAISFANDYCEKEMVEYGTFIHPNCLKVNKTKAKMDTAIHKKSEQVCECGHYKPFHQVDKNGRCIYGLIVGDGIISLGCRCKKFKLTENKKVGK